MISQAPLPGLAGQVSSALRAASRPSGRKPAKAACPGCTGQVHVRSSGNPDTAKLVVIGEKPGPVEVERGEAWVGPTGQLMRRLLVEETGLRDRDVYYGNVIPCLASTLTTEPQKVRAGKHCVQYIEQELARLPGNPPILLAGGVALHVVTGEGGIMGERGIVRRLPDGRACFPIMHPAYLLRAESTQRDGLEWTLRQDLQRFGEWLRSGAKAKAPIGRTITTERDLLEVEGYLIRQPLLFFDFETPGLAAWGEAAGSGRILSAGFACRPGEAFGIPVDCGDGPLDPKAAWAAIGRILSSPAEKGGLHLQHDLHWAAAAGFEVRNVRWDDMLAATLLADRPYTEVKSNLLRLAADWIGEIEYPWLHVDKARMAEYDAATVCGVAATDAEWELRIHLALLAELEGRGRAA